MNRDEDLLFSTWQREKNKYKNKKSLIYHNLEESSRQHHSANDMMRGRKEKEYNKQIGGSM